MKIDIKNVKQLIKLLESSQLAELEITEGAESIRLSRYGDQPIMASAPMAMQQAIVAPAAATPAPAQAESAQTDDTPAGHHIKSPMVGNFYRSPAPGANSFIEVGQHVGIGDTLCIIEAMKMMNHIEADKSGTVKAILVEDGAPVEYDQVLVVIE